MATDPGAATDGVAQLAFITDDAIASKLEAMSRRLRMLQNFGEQLLATLPGVAREIRSVSDELDELRRQIARG